jgi:hypothetical protein
VVIIGVMMVGGGEGDCAPPFVVFRRSNRVYVF